MIVVDKANAAAGKVRLNYLVNATSWMPQYKLRTGAEKDPVQVEYLAAIEQQSGEDWNGVDLILSTAQPRLNAAPPEFAALDISISRLGGPVATGEDARLGGAQSNGQLQAIPRLSRRSAKAVGR